MEIKKVSNEIVSINGKERRANYKITQQRWVAKYEGQYIYFIYDENGNGKVLNTNDFTPKKVKMQEKELIQTCIKSDIPVYLVGPSGSGKNYIVQEIAKELNLDFYFTNSVQQEYKITGFIDAGGVYHETEFYKAFKNGGIFFLDEMDASIPEVLILLNAAIANRYFEFPNGRIEAHSKFRVVAAGNTTGNGANEVYNGRLVLDSSTLDRFAIIEIDYNKEIELNLAEGDQELVKFIRELRTNAKKTGIRSLFSYRCIITFVKLKKAGVPVAQIFKICLFKGLETSTIKMFRVSLSNKYGSEFSKVYHND